MGTRLFASLALAFGLILPQAGVQGGRFNATAISGTVGVANGGTGLTTLTAHNVYVGNGTSAPVAVPGGTNCVLLWTASSSDPTCATSWTAAQVTAKLVSSGTTPAVANVGANSCGTTAATIAGNDNNGIVTVGATSGTQCRIAFVGTAATRRECHVDDESTAPDVSKPYATYVDTTHTDLKGLFVAGDVLAYVCVAR